MLEERELRELIARKARELYLLRRGDSEGKCPKEPLPVDSKALSEILARCDVVLADFWAPWCGACRLAERVVEAIAKKYGGRVAVVKVNIDENPDLAQAYAVTSIPTLILFYKGREYRRFVGFHPLLGARVAAEIERLLGQTRGFSSPLRP